MAEVIGTARIDITSDASGVEAATAKAKASIASMSKDAQAQYSRLSAAEKRRIDGLIRQADTVGMTRAQQIAYNASLKSSGPLLDDLTRRLKANEAAAKKSGIEFNKYGLSAKQELAALRQTPAQLTDILVSLQGGQRPLTVLLQQGGQLRDVFGGIVPAAKAMGGALLGLVNPATLALGAFAALSAAYYTGATELDEYQKSAIMTGNALGLTVDRVSAMSAEMSKMSDVTRGEAAAALTEVAKSGKIASDQIESVATVAARSAKLLGRETSEVVQEFASLADKPAEAAAKLNEKYHFLSAAVYEQIKALEDQGRAQEAASLAQETLAQATLQRLDDVEGALGLIERAWNGAGAAAKKAWDAMLNIGRPETMIEKLRRVENEIRQIEDSIGQAISQGQGRDYTAQAEVARRQRLNALLKEQADLLAQAAAEDFTASAKAWSAEESQKRIDAINEWGKLTERNLSKQAQAEKDIARIREAGVAAGKTELQIEAAIAAYREKHKDKSGGPKNDAATRMLMTLREQEASLRAQADGTEKLSSAQASLVKFEQMLADIKTKQTLTADEKSILAAQDKLRAQHEINVSVEREAQVKLQQIEVEKQLASLRANQSLNQAQFMRELEEFGRGDRFRDLNRELKRVEEQYRRIIVAQSAKPGGITEEALAAIQGQMRAELEAARIQFEKRTALQEDWSLGAARSLENYYDQSRNVAKMTEDVFTGAFEGMTDSLTDFVMTGKASFSDLANSIIRDMIRMTIQQSITGPLAGALGGALSGWLGGTPMTSTPYGDVGTGGWYSYNAKGGVYDSPSLSAYSNQIHDTPKLFAFARGAGVFGEAGPEAIMPLKRGPDGRLGVSTHGGGGVGDVTVNITNVGGQPMQAAGQPKVSIDSMGRMFIDLVVENITRHGQVAKAIEGRYGLR